MRPVYLCLNAIQREHKCVYAMCYSCKISEEDDDDGRTRNSTVKRRSTRFDNSDETNDRQLREKLNNKYDNEARQDPDALKYSCRHNNRRTLIPFTDSEFFAKQYQEKIESDGISFPLKCGECRCRLKG